jgi:hypothetical protein
LNTPLIIAGLINALASYKLQHTSRRRFLLRVFLWLVIFVGLLFIKPVYSFLFSNNLTHTEPLSLFDVMQITGIIFTLFIANKAYSKVDLLERRIQDLHQELSIQLSKDGQRRYGQKKP